MSRLGWTLIEAMVFWRREARKIDLKTLDAIDACAKSWTGPAREGEDYLDLSK